MADDVDESKGAKEQAEPWPVWLGMAREGEQGVWGRRTVWRDTQRAVGLATAAFVLSLVSIASGHLQIPLWLLLGHLPFFTRPYYSFLYNDAFPWSGPGGFSDWTEYVARARVMYESSHPKIPSKKFFSIAPVLISDTGIETFSDKSGSGKWQQFKRYEYVGEEGQAYIFRLLPADGKARKDGAVNTIPRPGFWQRVALAVPFFVSLYAFVVGLERHGWRVDTIAAFCALLFHLILRQSVKRLRHSGLTWFLIGDAPTYLIFDKRVVTLSEALTRLNRHLPATTEII